MRMFWNAFLVLIISQNAFAKANDCVITETLDLKPLRNVSKVWLLDGKDLLYEYAAGISVSETFLPFNGSSETLVLIAKSSTNNYLLFTRTERGVALYKLTMGTFSFTSLGKFDLTYKYDPQNVTITSPLVDAIQVKDQIYLATNHHLLLTSVSDLATGKFNPKVMLASENKTHSKGRILGLMNSARIAPLLYDSMGDRESNVTCCYVYFDLSYWPDSTDFPVWSTDPNIMYNNSDWKYIVKDTRVGSETYSYFLTRISQIYNYQVSPGNYIVSKGQGVQFDMVPTYASFSEGGNPYSIGAILSPFQGVWFYNYGSRVCRITSEGDQFVVKSASNNSLELVTWAPNQQKAQILKISY